jgi:hypothetical protein
MADFHWNRGLSDCRKYGKEKAWGVQLTTLIILEAAILALSIFFFV